jgi:hypothetical protein
MLRVILTGCICGAALLIFLFAVVAYASSGIIMGSPGLTQKEWSAVVIKGAELGLVIGLIVGVILGSFKPDLQSWRVGGLVGLVAWGVFGAIILAGGTSNFTRKIVAMLICGLATGLAGAVLGSIVGWVIGVFVNFFNHPE